MLLNAGEEEHTDFSKLAKLPASRLHSRSPHRSPRLVFKPDAGVPAATQAFIPKSHRQISSMLFKEFVYPFELTSFLILVAIMGALVPRSAEKK